MRCHRFFCGSRLFFAVPVFFISLVCEALPYQSLPCQAPFDDEKITHCLHVSHDFVVAGRYEEAAAIYRRLSYVLDVFPLDLCYYFGISLYHTAHYEAAISLLTHYTNHARTPLPEAISLLSEVRAIFSAIEACSRCDAMGYRYVTHAICSGEGAYTQPCFSCKGAGYMMCPRCRGQGVEVILTVLYKKKYTDCSLCTAKGHIPCEKCHGNTKHVFFCEGCQGTGRVLSTIRCDHQP